MLRRNMPLICPKRRYLRLTLAIVQSLFRFAEGYICHITHARISTKFAFWRTVFTSVKTGAHVGSPVVATARRILEKR